MYVKVKCAKLVVCINWQWYVKLYEGIVCVVCLVWEMVCKNGVCKSKVCKIKSVLKLTMVCKIVWKNECFDIMDGMIIVLCWCWMVCMVCKVCIISTKYGMYNSMSGMYNSMSGMYNSMSGMHNSMSGMYNSMSGMYG